MVETYLKQDGQDVLTYIRNDGPKGNRFEYIDDNGVPLANYYPDHSILVANGFKKYIDPDLTRFETTGDYVWSSETVTHAITLREIAEMDQTIEDEVYRVSDSKVAAIAYPPAKVARASVAAMALLEKKFDGIIIARETVELDYLRALQLRTEAVRVAGDTIITRAQALPPEAKRVLLVDWAVNELDWPE